MSPFPLWLYGLTLGLGAALLFALQPFTGRLLLPLVGGSPGGWLTALCFFQLALLVGYILTHLTARLSPQRQTALVMLLLLLGCFFLPVYLPAGLADQPGPLHVLGGLVQAVALPFVALSMLSGTLQRLAALHYPGAGIYRLYAASNLGSLLGLLAYPLLMEPLLTLSGQQALWSAGYLVVMALLALLLAPAPAAGPTGPAPARCGLYARLRWAGLAAVPASLSLGVTAILTGELGSLPVIWLLPLLLYLLSFIIAFGWPAPSVPGYLALSGQLLLWLSAALLTSPVSGLAVLPVLLISFFVTALYFHWRLAAARPPAAQLTDYYLWLAAGGAAGGLFNALLAPVLFSYPVEYPLVMALAGLLAGTHDVAGRGTRRLAAVSLTVIVVFLSSAPFLKDFRVYRNFFGMAVVNEGPWPDGERHRWIMSGDGIQGSQRLTPGPDLAPQLYLPPIAPVMAQPEIRRVGMLGLGAGMALCFTAPGRVFTVYEIDPKYRQIAETEFTYLRSCGEPRWRMGDGRLRLAEDSAEHYDAMIIDAFQGGHIPLHLITVEALRLYQSRLTAGGVLLYNLNSRYYDFFPQLAAQAAATGWQAWRAPESWLLLARYDHDVSYLAALGWHLMVPPDHVTVWSDDYANRLSALRVFSRP